MKLKQYKSRNLNLISIATILFLCNSPITAVFTLIFPPGAARDNLIGFIMYGALLFGMIRLKKKVKWDFLIPIAVTLISFLLYYFFHPEYAEIYDEKLWTRILGLGGGVWGYVFVRQNYDYQDLSYSLKVSAVILFLFNFYRSLSIILYGVISIGSEISTTYSMSFGYDMLLPVIIFLYYGLSEKKSWMIILAVVGSVEIILYGSRAALLSIVAFVLLYYLLISIMDQKASRKATVVFVVVMISVLFYLYYDVIIDTLIEVTNSYGISSRTLEKLSDEVLFEDAAREYIQSKIYKKLENLPTFGYGPLSDQYFIDTYSHNMLLELRMTYGNFFGYMLFGVLCWHVINMFFVSKNREMKGVFLIFFSCSFIRLLVSNTFWYDYNFWIMLAIISMNKQLTKNIS